MDFEKVKDRICFRLINRDKNRSFLEKVPYIPVLDLAACFYYAYELIMQIEEEFEVEIPDEVASNMKTVKDIVDYIEANK